MICPICKGENTAGSLTCFTCGKPLGELLAITKGSIIASRYEILASLGMGGMGMVFKAHDRVLEEAVAIKFLRSDTLEREPELARRFRSEIKLARKVSHRNVCRIHEYGEQGALRYISMEFVDGVDLKRIVRESKGLPAAEAFDVATQIALGLEAIHEVGVIHRDLKTQNIIVDARGVVRLLDFGIAKLHGEGATLSGTATGLIVGTPEYMSPEQARGEKVDFRSDIYALGVVIYELFTGQVPFRGDTPVATILKHISEPPPLDIAPGTGIPPEGTAILRRALAKDPGERFATVSEVVHALLAAKPHFKAADGDTSRSTARMRALSQRRAQTTAIAGATALMSAPVTAATPTSLSATSVAGRPTILAEPVAPTILAEPAAPTITKEPGRSRLLAWGAVGAVAALAAAAWAVGGRPVAAPVPPASTAVSMPASPVILPVAPPIGITINALPWARVRLVPASRDTQPAAEGGVTPYFGLVRPGVYEVELENGDLTPPLRQTIEVRPGGPTAFVFTMPGFNPARVVENITAAR